MFTSSKLLLLTLLIISLNSFSQVKELWGTTAGGGNSFGGVIFKTDSGANQLDVVHHFKVEISGNPNEGQLLNYGNGKLYGTTFNGGQFGLGSLYEYDIQNAQYKELVSFGPNNTIGGSGGKSLLKGSNGNIYGIAGGTGDGSIYHYEIASGVLTEKAIFTNLITGRLPRFIIDGKNGKYYGITQEGGSFNRGTLFEYNPSNDSLKVLVHFDGTANTAYARSISGITIYNNSILGISTLGGTSGLGGIFEYNLMTNSITQRADFTNSSGFRPGGALLINSKGKAYGATGEGGAFTGGTFYEYDIANDSIVVRGNFRTPFNFGASGPIEAKNGIIYGTLASGGAYENGLIYEFVDSTLSFVERYHFFDISKGKSPRSALVEVDSLLIAVSGQGGLEGNGTIYAYNYRQNSIQKLLDFGYASEGKTPLGNLLFASNKKFYGITHSGGIHGAGTLFEYDPTSDNYTKLLDFGDTTIGSKPTGGLIEVRKGKLYGACSKGGKYNRGSLFEYDLTTNTFSKLYQFDDFLPFEIQSPIGKLIKIDSNTIYGVTRSGNVTRHEGTLFEFNLSNNTFIKRYEFTFRTQIKEPNGALVYAPNGKIYGTTVHNFPSYIGNLFEYDPVLDTLIVKPQFQINGQYGNNLLLANNGKIYGTTISDVANTYDNLFEYDYNVDSLSSIADLNQNTGFNPFSGLMQTSNGNLYGLSNSGGVNGFGVIFQYDFSNSSVSGNFQFNGSNGAYPVGLLTEVDACQTLNTSIAARDSSLIALVDSATYRWLDCNNNYLPILNANNQAYIPLDTGAFAVEITKNGCVDTSECYLVKAVSIMDNQLLNETHIFPNPFDNFISVRLPFQTKVELYLYDVKGRLILRKEVNTNNPNVQLNVKQGVYFLRVIAEGESKTFKITKI